MSRFIVALIAAALCVTSFAQAESKVGAARSAARKVQKDLKDLKRKVKRLSVSQKNELKAAIRGMDSDEDGVPDFIEDSIGSNSCNSDSDGDGVDDGDDGYENNRDGDNDGHEDGDEVQKQGDISDFFDPSFVVGGQAFLLTNTTRFRGGISRSDLADGVCVKVEGHTDASDVVADKIESCEGDD